MPPVAPTDGPTISPDLRAARFAALGDPVRLGIVDELARSDRSPQELGRRFDLASNRLAHHLDVLEDAGLIERSPSSGDRRRRYVHLRRNAFEGLVPRPSTGLCDALFVCSANSARSQLAAVVWEARTGSRAASAGTHPAERVHPGAVAAAARAGLDLRDARPCSLDEITPRPPFVVTVCDRAHEELDAPATWWHWSIPDPVEIGTAEAFDVTVSELRTRIEGLLDDRTAS